MNNYYFAIVILLTIFAVYNILKSFGVFDFTKEPSIIVSDIKKERRANKKRGREQKKLALYAAVTNLFRGLLMNQRIYEEHDFYIKRLELKSKILNRFYKPEELRGKYALILIIGLFCIPLGVLFKPAFVVTGLTLFNFLTYTTNYARKIEDEDKIIDDNFLNLYLLLYSRLRQGSRARLQGVLESYIETLASETNGSVKETMLKFSRFMLNNLIQYEDHVAIPMLKERYKCATITNFCNVAAQALQGVSNADNLLTLKMQLVERKTLAMEKRSERSLQKGKRSIILLWIMLGLFVCLGWVSKIPTGYM